MQEVGLAKSAIAFTRGASIQFSEIVQFAVIVVCHPNLLFAIGTPLKTGRISDALLFIWSGFSEETNWMQEMPILKDVAGLFAQNPFTFVGVLFASTSFESTEERDHIYAFLGRSILFDMYRILMCLEDTPLPDQGRQNQS